MYERFTDRARKVMQLADKEAARFNHEFIATEHLLLGLLKEGSGVAACVLMNFGLDVLQVRAEAEKIVCCGLAKVCLGKLPLTPRTKNIIEYARDEARNLNHIYVGTEHLLLGLLRDREGVAFQILKNLGLSVQDIRGEVLSLLGHEMTSEQSSDDPIVPLSPPLLGESAERERIRALEQQLWNVRVVLGALVGVLAGVLLFASMGGVIGLLLGGLVAALGWRILGILAGGGVGILLGCIHLRNDGGAIAGALLGTLVGYLIAEIGGPSDRQGFLDLFWRRR